MKAGHSKRIDFLTDALGSVRDIVRGSDGTVLESYDFDERGNKSVDLDGGIDSQKTYWGSMSVQDETSDTGLYLAGHRWFDPGLGRFLSRDPIGFAGGLNLYSLSANNQVTLADPTGLLPGPSASPTVRVNVSAMPSDQIRGLEVVVTLTAINSSFSEGFITTEVLGELSRPQIRSGKTLPQFPYPFSSKPVELDHFQNVRDSSPFFTIQDPDCPTAPNSQRYRFIIPEREFRDGSGGLKFDSIKFKLGVVGLTMQPGPLLMEPIVFATTSGLSHSFDINIPLGPGGPQLTSGSGGF